MFDEPTVDELLAAVSAWLRDTLAPGLGAAEAFQARVAVNALDLVRRELAQGDAARAGARLQLQALLSVADPDAPLDDLLTELARRIREREFTPATPGLIDALRQHTLAKMAVEQPGHALFRQMG